MFGGESTLASFRLVSSVLIVESWDFRVESACVCARVVNLVHGDLGQNCTTPPFNRYFGIFLGWHVIIWDGSQVKAFPNPDHPPLAIFLTYQAFCTGMKIVHLILLRCTKLKSESFLLL